MLRQTLAAAREPVTLANGYVVECEWNIRGDIAAAQTACEKWPSELIFCSYEIGLPIITCGEMQANAPALHPVRLAYALWHEKCREPGLGRESWDAATMLYGIRPDAGYWGLHPYGKISVDARGKTTWQALAGGKHAFLTEKKPPRQIGAEIDAIIDRDLKRTPRA